MELLILILCCVRIYTLARLKGLNPAGWALRTFVTMFLCTFAGAIVSFFIQLGKHPDLRNVMVQYQNTHKQDDFLKVYMRYMDNIVIDVFLIVCALGGFLLVRHRLSRHPDKPDTMS